MKSSGFADSEHSFRHQGSADVNLYKLFLEQAHVLLRDEGRLGFIVPSGLYSDHGTGGLRQLFLDRCRWEWLFSFENREGIFEIHRSYKFNPVIIEKGGTTAEIRTAFMRRKLEDWENAESFVTPYTRAQVERFSPRSKSILEIQSARDLEILEKIYANSVLLGDNGPDGWGIKYATEFHMTNDSKLFPPKPKWEEQGYRPDEYSRWLKGDWRPIAELWTELGVKPLPEGERRCAQPPYDTLPVPRADIPVGVVLSRDADAWVREERVEDVALPLYEGRMIGQFDFSQKGWVSGKGRTAKWRDIDWDRKQIEPQYLLALRTWQEEVKARYLKQYVNEHGKDEGEEEKRRLEDPGQFMDWWWGLRRKVAFIDVTSATNTRTMLATVFSELPCGNSVPVLKCTKSPSLLSGLLNAFAYDAVARLRCGGVHLNWFVIDESVLPNCEVMKTKIINHLMLGLACPDSRLAEFWISEGLDHSRPWKGRWATTAYERLRLRCILDAAVASLYGLNQQEFSFVLKTCDEQRPDIARVDAKGFWRVDKDKDPELRHTVLTLVAFHDLEEKIRACGGDREKGIEAFLSQNDGEGWMLPETLRLADYGLGHDERAKEHQPVASRLGPRFYDWQLAQSPEESWRECHLHARNLLGEEGYKKLLDEIEGKTRGGYGTIESKPVEIREPGADCQDLPLFRSKT